VEKINKKLNNLTILNLIIVVFLAYFTNFSIIISGNTYKYNLFIISFLILILVECLSLISAKQIKVKNESGLILNFVCLFALLILMFLVAILSIQL